MGVVCCESSPKLAHQDDDTSSMVQDQSPSATAVSASPGTLPSDRTANVGHHVLSKPVSQANHNTSNKDHTNKPREAKKTVRINDEVTIIPMLTSSAFVRKTPKPTTITYTSSGIMPSFRIVTPDAITNGEGSDPQDDDDDLVSKDSLWWTKVERREIIQANQKVSRDFKRFQPTKLRKANLIYNDIVMECCCNDEHDDEDYDDNDIYDFFQRKRLNGHSTASATSSSTSFTTSTTTGATSRSNFPTKKRKRIEFSPTVLYDRSDLSLPEIPNETIDLPNNVRGLEWGVMPDAKRYRKAHARTVLRWQDRFRKMNDRQWRRRNGHHNFQQDNGHQDDGDSSEWSSSSSSSDDDDDIDFDRPTSEHKHQQDLLLGYKASISSLRSCMLARVFGKSDEIAANPSKSKTSDLEERRSSSWSPTPSLTGTTDESESSSESEEDDSDSDSEEDEDYSDSDSEEDEEGNANSIAYRGGYYSSSLSFMNANSHQRMFRPRMMPTYR